MKWSNVKLILLREIRDQLRDRRTLFTIAVLPLLLYPLLGMTFLHVSQFLREHPTRVWVIGAAALPDDPPLLSGDRFHDDLFSGEQGRLITLAVDQSLPPGLAPEQLHGQAQREIREGKYDAVVYFPPHFDAELTRFRQRLRNTRQAGDQADDDRESDGKVDDEAPQPTIFYDRARDKSRIAYDRVESVLSTWRDKIVEQNLKESHIPVGATQPFMLTNTDVAEDVNRRAALWSKILPFVVLVWALTGAFYPAIDLCAGEKERGTLETLLSSPAQRSEIVWGKLLTIMAFSMCTSLLNMVSLGLTGVFIMKQMQHFGSGMAQLQLGPPPMAAMAWLVLALVPISALFSALSLAIAAFARSSKEGQYYLMPLLLIMLPLMMLPMLPAAELDLGTSLIPVTGVMLLLRSLIEGQFNDALLYSPPVIAVTAVCCLLAIRWAIDQFNDETVLFRESERFGLGLWMRHLVRDRRDTPSAGEAVLCGVLLLLIKFFAGFVVVGPQSWRDIASITLITQIALIAAPALLMTIMLTRSPRKTLLLRMPRPMAIPAAILLAITLGPLITFVGQGIEWLYPVSEDTLRSLQPFAAALKEAPLPYVLLLVALTPAICEELAFRGFILSGLRHMGHRWAAIILSSVFFGLTHGLIQQSLAACTVGVVIGYIAVQTGSLLPGIFFHLTHNTMMVLAGRVTAEQLADHSALRWLFRAADATEFGYHWYIAVIGGIVSIGVLLWFRSLPYQPYAEEKLQEALDHQSAHAAAR
jgi:sodium transport system permease protein